MVPAKILLFGEYIVIKGAQALVVPFSHFGGEWKYSNNPEGLQANLSSFADYLAKSKDIAGFDEERMKKELKDGLYFQSNIPTGYGLGSSGAVTAGVYERFFEKNEQDLGKLKALFGRMESFFHGTSSGIDPLICHIKRPIWLKSKQELLLAEPQKLKGAQLFLLDTKKSRKTEPFVNIFLDKWIQTDYSSFLTQALFSVNNTAIEEFLAGEGEKLYRSFSQISEIQFSHFSEMILPEFKTLWQQSLQNETFKLKLCGAGGGGYILGITQDYARTQKALKEYSLIKLS